MAVGRLKNVHHFVYDDVFQALGRLLASSVFSRMLVEAGLQLPHLVFMRRIKSLLTCTPRMDSHFEMSGSAADRIWNRYQPSSTALL